MIMKTTTNTRPIHQHDTCDHDQVTKNRKNMTSTNMFLQCLEHCSITARLKYVLLHQQQVKKLKFTFFL